MEAINLSALSYCKLIVNQGECSLRAPALSDNVIDYPKR